MIRRLGLLLLAAGLVAAAPASVTGPARVVDGDTFSVGAERVRLWGVDAPEGRQVCQNAKGQGYACGDVARDRLVGLIGGRIVRCEIRDRDPYGRAVSRCQAGPTDLGGALVRAGWAVDYAPFSRGAYASTEAEARRARRGLWAGRFEAPSSWRAAARQARPAPAPPPQSGCAIKGNISAKGRRIFHVPSQEDYAATRIDTSKGERWFCSLTRPGGRVGASGAIVAACRAARPLPATDFVVCPGEIAPHGRE